MLGISVRGLGRDNRRRGLRALPLAALVSTLVGVPLAGTASAAVSCRYDAKNKTVVITYGQAGDSATISRSGAKITVTDKACGNATVHNTRKVNVDGGGLGGGESLTIDLSNGPFSNIAFNVTNFSEAGSLTVEGSKGDDVITSGRGPLLPPNVEKGGIDLDGDLKADIVFCGTVDDCDTTGLLASGVKSIVINGNEGNDRLSAAGGGTVDDLAGPVVEDAAIDDELLVILDGGPGVDVLDMSAAPQAVAANLISGTATGSRIVQGFEDIVGSRFDDDLNGDDFPNRIFGGPGDDTIKTLGGGDFVDGGEDTDTIIGGWGDDEFHGGPGADTIDAGLGNDRIFADDGDDNVTGAPGDDAIEGGPGDDTLQGNEGNDLVFGGDGTDTIDGGLGDDRVTPGPGDDVVNGAPGWDTLDFSPSPLAVRVNLVTQEAEGEGTDDPVLGFEVVIGTDKDDTLTGDTGDNVLIGRLGNDKIAGGDGNDVLDGGPGDDSFDEDSKPNGADQIIGGEGNDTVDYSTRQGGMVTVTLDGVANDGAPGEGDNVSEVEKQDLPGMTATGVVPLSAGPGGYWLVAADGGIFSFGDAQFYGSTGNIALNHPVVAMAATPTGKGYWLVAADGGIFSFGDAEFYGSTGAIKLNKPVVGMAPTPTGKGYWLVASDGGIFAFGDATFAGSLGRSKVRGQVVGIAPSLGQGYWLAGSDGAVSAFGEAALLGAPAPPAGPIVQIVALRRRNGYLLVGSDGSTFAFGDAGSLGSLSKIRLNQPIVGAAAPF
ncbi:MAG TPA: calcium-binding protein [Acidimicrobiia bacterium]|nr:calcium-binding protein [Acidimicrobiia bacterium]